MFRLNASNGSFSIQYDGHAAVEGLDVFVRLRDEDEIRLIRTEEGARNGDGDALRFADEEGNIRVDVRFDVREQGVLMYVDGTVDNASPFGRQRTFAPTDGIVVRFAALPGLTGLMANYQHKDWWTRPYFRPDLRTLPGKTLSLLWRTERTYGHLLPVTGERLRADLEGGEPGLNVRLSAYQGGFGRYETLALVLTADESPFELPERGLRLAGETGRVTVRPRADKAYPAMLDGLGWCSWDAFYHDVSAEGLDAKLAELHGMGLPIRWVMIDDGWSDVKDRKLRSFDAEPSKFPNGLGASVRSLKERYGVRHVGVWHTIAGYWGGIDPTGELFAQVRGSLHEANGGAWIPAPDAAVGFGFWNAWHDYLRRQGVDFVKVDSQSAVLNFLRDQKAIGAAAKAMHTSLEASVALRFDGCVINCMGMAGENVWNRPASSLSRNSDDFVPNEPHGFREHALQNAYNSFYHGAFYWGDWDMYWTDHHEGRSNMVLRAVSGGPVYVSDKMGGTDPSNLWPIVYRDGSIVRCDEPGRPGADCLTVDPSAEPIPLKVWSRSNGTGVLALFHVYDGDQAAEGTVSAADIPGLETETVLVWNYFAGEATKLAPGERLPVQLEPKGTALYSLVPLRHELEPIGLIGKLVPAHGVERIRREADRVFVRLKEGGLFAFVSEREPARALSNGRPVGMTADSGRAGVYTMDCGDAEGPVDVEIVLRA
ncbi:Sip1-related alpha-galactosidase [Paenibacillus flagellatus]|nr:Sip1-related alpha-galactosidase [Paenibacillus flagellatus]